MTFDEISTNVAKKVAAWNAATDLVATLDTDQIVSEYSLDGGGKMTRLDQHINAIITVADWLLYPIEPVPPLIQFPAAATYSFDERGVRR